MSERSIRRIHHVQITIPPGAEAAAREFYCGTLGLRETAKPESLAGRGGFWLELGDQQLHVGVEDGFDRLTTKAHVAYEVDDAAYWQQRLESAGATIAVSVPIPGFARFETRDPFGNRIELIQPLPEADSESETT
ncbi:MAG: VOC family protein [Chloroflexota bacterium]